MKTFLIAVFLLFTFSGKSQIDICGKVYEAEMLTKEPVFAGTSSQFMKLMMDSVLCDIKPTAYGDPPTRLKAKVTINSKGQIIDSFIFTEEFEKQDQELIKKRLLKLDSWLPAEIDGQKVCSNYVIVISCIIWN